MFQVGDILHGISTVLIGFKSGMTNQGSGFFYLEYGDAKDNIAVEGRGQWRLQKNLWLVTNRHVVLVGSGADESLPDWFSFHLRKVEGSKLVWDEVRIESQELQRRARFHPDATVDLCVIEIHDLLLGRAQNSPNYMAWHGISNEELPGKKHLQIDTCDDALIIGYPRAYFDHVNLFPIIKSGIIASKFGARFEGRPYFLVDAKLFPGSSGSLVISKPVNVIPKKEGLVYTETKMFSFLGILSGEPFKGEVNLGIVWYGELVDEIIKSGIQFPKK